MGSSPCDPISGDCYCKRFVAGRSCSQCVVQPGFFCAPLDYYTYEAEQATGHGHDHPQLPGAIRVEVPQDCLQYNTGEPGGRKGRPRHQRSPLRVPQPRIPLRRSHQQPRKPDMEEVVRDNAGHMVTWTGSGFARVRDGAGLTFRMDNVPYPMDYELLLRYEPESAEDWEVVVSVSSRVLPTSPRCGNLLPSEQMYHENLPHSKRYVLLSRPFCFEPSTPYQVTMRLQRAGVTQRHPSAFILIDSLVLLPRVLELPGFHGAEAAARQEELERYRCLEVFHMPPPHPLAQACARLVCSVSALMHGGALPCQCNPQGSRSSECQVQGGQCKCKTHVIGRRCDRCAPGSYGFGPLGCSWPRCDRCSPGYFGAPEMEGGVCRPCQCNNNIDTSDPGGCDPRTGQCLRCLYHTAGPHCAQCQPGYYGNALQRSCRPCECEPLGSESPQCEQDSGQCQCRLGFGGLRCDHCQRGYQEPFPHCSPCHPCFGHWDPAVGSLQDRLWSLGVQVQALREGGTALPLSPRRLRELEEALGHVEQLLGKGNSPSSPLLNGLPGQLDGTRQVCMLG
ncbi:hypothetical protein WISP_130137 [Willisornis vidua]|uniref:LAMB1 protein n=1 Tax=Willisornis vidua TaxID=1566151 RepID=A0ABQ9CPM9_9PASS|nr:hypothetical protein WISP_130137 [Willisornis vidua]